MKIAIAMKNDIQVYIFVYPVGVPVYRLVSVSYASRKSVVKTWKSIKMSVFGTWKSKI